MKTYILGTLKTKKNEDFFNRSWFFQNHTLPFIMDSLYTFFRINPSLLIPDVRNTIISILADSYFADSIVVPVCSRDWPKGTHWHICKDTQVIAIYQQRLFFVGHIDKQSLLVQHHSSQQWYNLSGLLIFSVYGVVYDKRYPQKYQDSNQMRKLVSDIQKLLL